MISIWKTNGPISQAYIDGREMIYIPVDTTMNAWQRFDWKRYSSSRFTIQPL